MSNMITSPHTATPDGASHRHFFPYPGGVIGVSPTIGLRARLGAMFLLVAIVPYSIVMAFAFHLDGPSPAAVGICVFTLIPTVLVAFLLGHLRAQTIFQEASAQMELYYAERERNAQLDELNRLRSELVSAASHELRTPLSSLTMYMDTLADQWDHIPAAQKYEIARRARIVSKRMNRLVSDLLLAAQIQAESLPIDRGPITLKPLVEQAAMEVAAVHPGVSVDLIGQVDCMVLADGVRVLQVLVNLLDNAAKFARHLSQIRVAWESNLRSVTVRVSNSGPPIPTDQLTNLFIPFSRLATGAAAPVGTGLGLYVCKQLVEAMGGTIAAEGSNGTMTFSFTLPAAQNP